MARGLAIIRPARSITYAELPLQKTLNLESSMDTKSQPTFEQFLRERQYLTNVSPSTIEWYSRCRRWLPSETPTQDDLKDVVMRMREKGLKETGVNAILRCLNAYLHWASGVGPEMRRWLHSSTHTPIERARRGNADV
jgi:hypothetical protein